MSDDAINYPSLTEEQSTERYAGFWMRFWAYLADLIVIFSISGLLLSPLHFVNEGSAIEIGFWTLSGILNTLIFYLYFVFMTKYFNQTLGKMIFGLKVVRSDGKDLSWSDLIFREVIGRFFHRVFALTFLLYLIVAFTKEKQGLHDIVANTRVVHVH
ncbi:RDD family protein [Oceanobacillus halophilus]|uniref:RDD family protein n=1 Tax=Oceanobacillus halophilus TaxID=930130 RepID=A0A495A3U6_9BACI|nr:RDD family protein [Oceanobacillus halophilus]RKQ32950.1 RDD family protein [Oceanobacillus halophilus]